MKSPFFFAAIFFVILGIAHAATAPRRNVLFIIADDLNCDLGCYGSATVQTPNIDRIAARGVRFDRAYCQFPSCAPSRSSFLTGRRPNVTGVLAQAGLAGSMSRSPHFRDKITETVTLPQLFKQSGWFSARVGKAYHYRVPNDIGTSSHDDFPSWDYVINPRGRDRDDDVQARVFSLLPSDRMFAATLSWLKDDGADEDYTDGIGATDAVHLLERHKRGARPFFLTVGFYLPHTPFIAPKKYFDLYPKDKIKLPALSADDRARIPAAAYASARAEQDSATNEQRQEAIQAYYASVSFMDAQVGRVLDALDRLGLAQDTVVVFSSDHGYHLGEHGLWQKLSLFEGSTRQPLIIAAPGSRANGRAARGLVEMIDLYPTLAQLCGLTAPAYVEGVSLVPMLDDANAAVKSAAFSQVRQGANGDGYAVRTDRWRFIEWYVAGKEGIQLYDMQSDPMETKNLANDRTYAATVAEMRALIAPIRAK